MDYKAENGIQLTQGLFYEFNNVDAPFTLRSDDYTSRRGNKYVSVAKLFIESVDEYDAAIKILGSWEHWEKLCNLSWFTDGYTTSTGMVYGGLNNWRNQMKLRDESLAKSQLIDQVKTGNVAASRYLHEISTKQKAGRPETKKPKAKVSNVEQLWKDVKR